MSVIVSFAVFPFQGRRNMLLSSAKSAIRRKFTSMWL
jgi:hypothetical protein